MSTPDSVPAPPTPVGQAASTALTGLFGALLDDAALFPPGNAAMADALSAHPHHLAGTYGFMVGRFLCPASRVPELAQAWLRSEPLTVGLIADTGLDGLSDAITQIVTDPQLDLGAVEIVLPAGPAPEALGDILAALPAVTGYVELPRGQNWSTDLDAIAAAGREAKFRTGGATRGAVPAPEELAAFITACVARRVAFKCTAGLHHAICGVEDEAGNTQHGFLNVLLATQAAIFGEDDEEIVGWLREGSAEVIVHALRAMHEHDARRIRTSFIGFGSCSVTEPVNELTELGLL
ncbi:MAG: hypothetical protein H0T99_04810 [Geodermatophilaceae bacterium]|nr:hypothetical protein [Geodermatophilaceae bacterium]MDQ3475111.1 hypothetical protein [Actinomycetota bacterium]